MFILHIKTVFKQLFEELVNEQTARTISDLHPGGWGGAPTSAPASLFPSCLLFLVPFSLSCHLSAPPGPPTPPAPHQSLSAEQTASSPSILTPCSHIPLSRAAAVHKYINLVWASACVRTWRRRGNAQPAARQPCWQALYCVPSQTLGVYTSDPSRQTREQRRPENPSKGREADLEPAVPGL